MKFFFRPVILLLFLLTIHQKVIGQKDAMVLVSGGSYLPLYGVDSMIVKVDSFYIDVYPVTNTDYLSFVQKYPDWKRSKIKRLFSDANYLVGWEGDNSFGKHLLPDSPVTNISWFAAKKYCECLGKRLPTIDEWEFAAMADKEMADARKKETYNRFILEWYETHNAFNKPIGSTFKNYWGIYDLHGLVWEWTIDFNSVLMSGESRKDVDKDGNLFCGSAAVGASDLMNYAAFMRYAFRGSLKANYAVRNLGFRCAQNINMKTAETSEKH